MSAAKSADNSSSYVHVRVSHTSRGGTGPDASYVVVHEGEGGAGHSIENGLLVKVDRVDETLQSYTFALAQNSARLTPDGLGWVPLSRTQLPQKHIRYHNLLPERSESPGLQESMYKYQAEGAIAVVVVNTENTTRMAPLLTALTKVPVIVVASGVGEKLQQVISSSDERSVVCKVYPTAPKATELDVALRDVGQRIRAPSILEESFTSNDFLREVKRTLFWKKEAKSPMDKMDVFKKVMSLLSAYELMPERERENEQYRQPGRLYQKMKKRIEKFHTLKKDFIFYFILAFRFRQAFMVDIYQRNGSMATEMDVFNTFLIKSFKTFRDEEIVESFKTFLGRENFNVEMSLPDPTASTYSLDVFTLYSQACLVFTKEMDTIHMKMRLISMYLNMMKKLHISRNHTGVWKLYVIQAMPFSTIDDECMKDLKKGLRCIQLLEVSEEFKFNESLMADIFLSEDRTRMPMRPFNLFGKFLQAISPFVSEQILFTVQILQPARVSYKCLLDVDKNSMTGILCALTKSGDSREPELGAVREGLMILDEVMIIRKEKKWDEACELNGEIQDWLVFLLSLVDFMKPSAGECLKEFFSGESQCCIVNQEFIRVQTIDVVEQKLRVLSVQHFYPLYEALSIWSIEFLTAYFTDYNIARFGLELSQNGWKMLLKMFCNRHTETHSHGFILSFLKSVADWYSQNHPPHHFFMDLLGLEVPFLFFKERNDLEVSNSLRFQFHHFLDKHYKQFQKQCNFTDNMGPILERVSIQRENYFQDTILQIIAKGTVYEIMQNPADSQAISGLAGVVGKVELSGGVFDDPLSAQVFCWTVVGQLCEELPSLRHFQKRFQSIFLLIGSLYVKYCQRSETSAETELVVKADLPEDLQNALPQTRAYFEWVRNIHSFLLGWNNKLKERKVNYGEIQNYRGRYSDLLEIMTALGSEKYAFDRQKLEDLASEFDLKRGKVNSILIQTIQESHQTLWCNLLLVLSEYGLEMPSEIIQDLERHIQFPEGKEGVLHTSASHPSFQKSGSISTKPQPDTSLRKLSELHDTLVDFFCELQGYPLDFLIFFRLHKSTLFDKYLRLHIQNVLIQMKSAVHDEPSLNIMPEFAVKSKVDKPSVVTVNVLKEAIKKTELTVCSLIEGKAKYKDIVAEGAVVLQDINTELEFSILEKSTRILSLRVESRSGLTGVRCILELFKASTHIETLRSIFERYHLERCAQDKEFMTLKEIPKLVNDQLTPNEATEKLKTVKDILMIQKGTSVDCLEFLNEVYKSKEFHKFLLRRRFYGDQGHRAFRQQYELITAQLQNKASNYEERILNHLFPAFQFISPFIVPKPEDACLRDQPSFGELVRTMWKLDITNGPSQLRNVYRNIHIVLQWFAQVQGDTAKSIETELQDVVKTGIFRLKTGAPLSLEFHRSAGVSVSESVHDLSLRPEIWHVKQIKEFVTRLGFLSSKESSGDKAKEFLSINEVAHLSYDLISKIKQFGESISIDILCSVTTAEAKDNLQTLQETLTKSKTSVSTLQHKYRWLYFIPGALVSKLYDLLITRHLAFDSIVKEVLLLFPQVLDAKQLKDSCVKSLDTCKAKLMKSQEEFKAMVTPMEFVGCFLDSTFTALSIEIPEKTQLPTQQHQVLHYAPGYGLDLLMKLLLEIYGRVPQRFQVFKCHQTCTEDELSFFFDKVEGIASVYTLLEVNNLSLPMQEYIVQRTIKSASEFKGSVVHYVETKPSALRDVLDIHEHDVSGPDMTKGHISTTFYEQQRLHNVSLVELVCGIPGDGKSHYILNNLQYNCSSRGVVTIPINEGFSCQRVVDRLRSLPLDADKSEIEVYGVFFNFTMCYPKDALNKEGSAAYIELFNRIGWFFFELLVLGAVEDLKSASIFRLHKTAMWQFYIEVPPSYAAQSNLSTAHQLEKSFLEFQESIPLFQYVGRRVMLGVINHYAVDAEVQLVCKYLKSCKTERVTSTSVSQSLSNLFRQRRVEYKKPSQLEDLPVDECLKLLNENTPQHATAKISQRLFVRYMHKRCQFLDKLPDLQYNPGLVTVGTAASGQQVIDSSQLCSTLMSLMLEEVTAFTNPKTLGPWSKSIPVQLIYDVHQDGSASTGVITSSPDLIKIEQRNNLAKVGIEIPTDQTLHSRDYLVQCLSRSLNVPKDDCMKLLAEENYVVTLDYILKMLNINERRLCGVPVVIEGETGVGKTALVEMLSKLWNYSQRKWIQLQKERFVDFIEGKLKEYAQGDPEAYGKALEIIKTGYVGCETEDISYIARLPMKWEPSVQLFTLVRDYILKIKSQGFWIFMKPQDPTVNFSDLLSDLESCGTLEATIKISDSFLNSDLLDLFYKLPIHAALTPDQVNEFFEPIFTTATELQKQCSSSTLQIESPIFVIFLDELNTASCGGVLKEIIVDHTLYGKPIPTNIFIVGACNPHRGNSLSLLESNPELWARGTYYVRPLHPTLRYLVWDYGALDESEEREYVTAKLELVEKYLPIFETKDESDRSASASLTELIVLSQEKMRENVFHYLRGNIDEKDENVNLATLASKSCVSQRDIQRVITFYSWILKMYSKFSPYGPYKDNQNKYRRRAVLVSLGIVYYLRLPDIYREKYETMIKDTIISDDINFSQAFNDDLEWMKEHVKIPRGIAITNALKENLFAMIACICTRTPLIIVGEPGSSKTLSFHLAAENLRGHESISDAFKETDIFPSIDPYFHQCSRSTTSNDIVTVFERAKGRQETLTHSVEKKNCVVFMDEAGLPEESRESLKALHYYLDKPSVAFVAISNHVLDAAKTNRCISVVRMKVSQKELEILAKGCLCDTPNVMHARSQKELEILAKGCLCDTPNVPLEREREISTVVKFCSRYATIIKDKYKNFFGLRDFVHFLHYLRRHHGKFSTGKLVLRALERNFNGVLSFGELVPELMEGVIEVKQQSDNESTEEEKARLQQNHEYTMALISENSRSIIDILQESLSDCPSGDNPENAVRYKLIIDPSSDNSLIRYLFKFGVVRKDNTRMFMCSDAFADEEAHKVSIVSSICHSVTEGHTVILSQTNEINESFYDLFNLRYRCIDDPNQGRLYYANVAIGAYIKPCPVNPKFQCIVLLHESDVPTLPAPFLNRFEKYYITYDNVLESALRKLPYGWTSLIQAARMKINEFADEVEASVSIYGYRKETVSSIFLWFLPAHPKLEAIKENTLVHHSGEPDQFLLETVLNTLREVGFYIPHCTQEEFDWDSQSLFRMIRFNPLFDEYITALEDHSVMSALQEAMGVLNSKQSYDCPILSVGACLMISLILQWTVRHLCKALMQVMTPEAMVTFHRKIPSSYVTNYLEYQEHFSLEKLIDRQYKTIQAKRNIAEVTCTKLLVFCRTSALIADLSFDTVKQRPVTVAIDSSPSISELSVSIISISSYYSEGSLMEKLHNFYDSDENHVLVLKVNMQETSVNAINHLRVMIEDVENQHSKYTKITVVLLHFPSSMFSEGTYPSLFQAGWSHFYLDSVSMKQETCAINTEQWIMQCCFARDYIMHGIGNSLLSLTEQSIPTIIPLLASKLRLNVGKNYSTKDYDLSTRKHMFSQLLNEKGIGKLLCIKFQEYWNPSLFAAYLKKAAAIIFGRESSVNMTVLIQNLVCAKFSEFVVYMVSVMIESHSLHLIFDRDCPSYILTLFKEVVKTVDLPEFSHLIQLNIIKRKAPKPSRQKYWSLPFYALLSQSVDDLVTECAHESSEQSIVEGEEDCDSQTFTVSPNEVRLTALVKMQLHKLGQDEQKKNNRAALATALKLIENNEDMLQLYFSNFISDKLSVHCSDEGVVFDILQEYFEKLAHCVEDNQEMIDGKAASSEPIPVSNAVMKVILYHISYRYHRDSLARILPIIKELDELQLLTKALEQTSFTRPPLAAYSDNALSLLSDPKCLCAYIVDLLFSVVVSVWMRNEYSIQWFHFYQKMTTNLHVKKILYKFMGPSEEGKLNTMHTAYAVLHCDVTDSQLKNQGYAAFWTLYNRFFIDQKLKDSKHWPHLEDSVYVIFESLEIISKEVVCVEFIIRGLLEHFFSKHRPHYHRVDIDWLLKLANEGVKWKQKPIRVFTDDVEHGIPLGVVKHYLLMVMTHEENPERKNITFADFNKEYRSAIGERLVGSDAVTQYSPYFYGNVPQRNQPLAHLYFLLVFETHIGNKTLSPVHVREEIRKMLTVATRPEEKYLLSIEQQAMIQTLLEKVAEAQIKGKSGHVLLQFDALLSQASPSEMLPHHSTVLAMHLLKHGRNLNKMRQNMDHLHKNGVSCVRDHLDALSHYQKEHSFALSSEPDLLSLKENVRLLELYRKVCKAMELFKKSGIPEDAERVFKMHTRWSEASLCLAPGKIYIDSQNCLNMMMWLAAYHCFYQRKRSFPTFIEVAKEKMKEFPAQVKLFELLLGFYRPDTSSTVLSKIFHPPNRNTQDQTQMEMRNCVVNIIAVTFGSPPRSNHLWYHLMEPSRLDGTYLTGFMYHNAVSSKSDSFYEDGTHLTESGFYGKYAYTADGGTRSLTLPSLYVLLWMNFAAFGMALHTKQFTSKDLSFVCSKPESLCSERLDSVWKHMTQNMDLCDEHVSHLVTNCLSEVLKESCASKIEGGGIFHDYKEVVQYEKKWQNSIFNPAYSFVSQKVSTQMEETPLLKDITFMKKRFPKLVSYNDLAYMLQAMPNPQAEYKLLSKFIVEYPRFHVGSSLLPDLIRLYQWLHREMAHCVTKKTASRLTLAKIKKQLAEKTPEKSKEFFALHESVLAKYNKYVSITGRNKGLKGDQQQWPMNDKTVLLDLVSGEPTDRDCLFRVINDIISSHRNILQCVSKMATPSNGLERYTYAPCSKLHPALISPSECLINTENVGSEAVHLKLLMSKWSCLLPAACSSSAADAGGSTDPGRVCTEYNVLQLQEDVVDTYLAGKAMIGDAQQLHTTFIFVSSSNTSDEYSNQELAYLSQQLPKAFKEEPSKIDQKAMESEFHSASFEAYQGLISSLTTSLYILVNEVSEGAKNGEVLLEQTLGDFLHTEREEESFLDIEIKRCRFSKAQVSYIKKIKLRHLFSTLLIFIKWNDAGVYDFHMLPYAMKGKMADEDEATVQSTQHQYQERNAEFLRDLKLLESGLVHLQPKIIKLLSTDNTSQTSIVTLMDKDKLALAWCIPETVRIHHYVSLRLVLRSLMLTCQRVKPEIDFDYNDDELWQECELEPWKKYLHCHMKTPIDRNASFSTLSRERYGFTTRAVQPIDQTGETFDCVSESGSASTTAQYMDYMSDLMSLDIAEERSLTHCQELRVIPGKRAAEYDVEEVCQFLTVIGLPQCVEWAQTEEITGELLMGSDNKDLTDENLKGLGLENNLHRLKLLVSLERLENDCRLGDKAIAYPPRKIADFLSSQRQSYEKYIQLVLDNGIDGEMLYRASEQALTDLGIDSPVDRALMKQKFCAMLDGPTMKSQTFPPERVCKVLIEMKLNEAVKFVMKHGIDGEVVANASNDLMKEMGVKTKGQMRKLQSEFKEM